ncbi:hypothetical protein ACFU7Y_06400 [Kitasatospora sp. NPDC057542]|uniref:hypothetical protein n=1 Tax=Kitasatospora sp. NPDC057542 TaxID=3346162 RepID=UPI0036AC4C60
MTAPIAPSASGTRADALPPSAVFVSPTGPVPRITSWSGEVLQRPRRIRHDDGGKQIGYWQETAGDRVNGVLVLRSTGEPGQGVPVWTRSHPGRQVQLMLTMACRVCGEPADHTEQGTLWLLPRPRMRSGRVRRLAAGWPEGAVVEHPPVCAAHALQAPGLCRALDGALLVRVTASEVWGVAGWCLGPEMEPVQGSFSFTEPELLRWVVATHVLRTVTGCTVLTAEELRADLACRRGGR